MRISNILKTKQTVSFEFFPPKEAKQEPVLFETIEKLKNFIPDFASITYGAGGSTRDRTFSWSKTLSESFTTMMHLTCYGNTPELITETCRKITEAGIKNVLALRGDPPKDSAYSSVKAFDNAGELAKHIKNHFPDLCIGVAGYPEKHPDAPSLEIDVDMLKRKLDNGGEFIITQLFFDNSSFFRFMDVVKAKGITAPVVAGIMPLVNYAQIENFTKMFATTIPKTLIDKIEKADEADISRIGEEFAAKQVMELRDNGVDGIHFYTLNRSPAVSNILNLLPL